MPSSQSPIGHDIVTPDTQIPIERRTWPSWSHAATGDRGASDTQRLHDIPSIATTTADATAVVDLGDVFDEGGAMTAAAAMGRAATSGGACQGIQEFFCNRNVDVLLIRIWIWTYMNFRIMDQ